MSSYKKSKPGESNIFIGPIEITGQYRNLAIAIRKQNFNCDYYTFYSHPFSYGGDLGSSRVPYMMRRVHRYGKSAGSIKRLLSIIAFEFLRLIFFIKAVQKYDVFLFGFGASLLRGNIDLPVLRLFGKKIVANMSHGSDMTPAYLNGALMNENGEMPEICDLIQITRNQLKVVRRFEKYADHIIGSPLSSSFLASKPFINIFSVGRVCQAQNKEITPSNSEKHSLEENVPIDFLKILHAPSHSPGKGSKYISHIVNSLIERNFKIHYKQLTDVDNDTVLNEMLESDLIIDQLYADLPLSGIAMEASSLGKPVIIGGYGLENLNSILKTNEFPPTIICHPDGLEKLIMQLIDDRSQLDRYREKSQHFVNHIWDPKSVATRYLTIFFNDPIPREWIHDPKNHIYLHGYGLTEDRIKKIIVEVIATNGIGALCLSHRPDLMAELTKFADVDYATEKAM